MVRNVVAKFSKRTIICVERIRGHVEAFYSISKNVIVVYMGKL